MKSRASAIIISAALSCLCCASQGRIGFAYDEAGNRVKRELVIQQNKKSQSRSKDDSSFIDALGAKEVRITANATGIIDVFIINYEETDKGFIEVHDTKGLLVSRQDFAGPQATVDISASPTGIYVLDVVVNGTPTVWKIAKK